MIHLFVAANDDNPTQEWLEFVGTPPYKWGLANGHRQLIRDLKHSWRPDRSDRHASNFIWFIRFEYSFAQEEKGIRE